MAFLEVIFFGVLLIAAFMMLMGIAGKIMEWDEKKTDGCGCLFIGIAIMAVIMLLAGASQCRSCISESGRDPGAYDYYDHSTK